MNYSLVILAPVDKAEATRDLAEQLGWGRGLQAQASADGTEPATHYGSRAWADQAAIDLITSIQAGNWLEGVDPDQETVDSLIIDYREDAPGVGGQHYLDVLSDNGLRPVEVSDEPD